MSEQPINYMSKGQDLTLINPVAILLESPVIKKSDISSLSDLIVEKIFSESQGVNELVVIEALKKVCEEVSSKLRLSISMDKIETQSVKGVKVEESTAPRTFDYSVDVEVVRLEAILKARKDLLKKQYEILNNPANLGKDIPGIVDENGEILPMIPIKSGGGSIIKLTFPK